LKNVCVDSEPASDVVSVLEIDVSTVGRLKMSERWPYLGNLGTKNVRDKAHLIEQNE